MPNSVRLYLLSGRLAPRPRCIYLSFLQNRDARHEPVSPKDRKLGALELLLVAPIYRFANCFSGHWLALLRQLGGAMLGNAFSPRSNLLGFPRLLWNGKSKFPAGAFAVIAAIAARAPDGTPPDFWHVSIICPRSFFFNGRCTFCLNWITPGPAPGTWIALRTRRPTLAPWDNACAGFLSRL